MIVLAVLAFMVFAAIVLETITYVTQTPIFATAIYLDVSTGEKVSRHTIGGITVSTSTRETSLSQLAQDCPDVLLDDELVLLTRSGGGFLWDLPKAGRITSSLETRLNMAAKFLNFCDDLQRDQKCLVLKYLWDLFEARRRFHVSSSDWSEYALIHVGENCDIRKVRCDADYSAADHFDVE